MMQDKKSQLFGSFPSRLKAIRNARKLSQAELARRSGNAANSVYNWENGKGSPRQPKIERLAEALNVSVAFLQNGVPRNLEDHKLLGHTKFAPRGNSDLPLDEDDFSGNPEASITVEEAAEIAAMPSPTEEDLCHSHLKQYLKMVENVPGAAAHALIQLELHLPLSQARKLAENRQK
ncbi:MAG: helix-turn-helix domain-containing protein [Verrucomicrobiales bacterium]